MIEIGSFIGIGAMVGDGITIKNVSRRDLGIIPDAFRRLGVTVEERDATSTSPARNIMRLSRSSTARS